MKEYILKGDPAEVEKVIRENRIRISRGVISITPAEPEASEVTNITETVKDEETIDDKNPYAEDFKEVDLDADTKEVTDEDTKEAPIVDTKEVTPPKKSSRSKKKSD